MPKVSARLMLLTPFLLVLEQVDGERPLLIAELAVRHDGAGANREKAPARAAAVRHRGVSGALLDALGATARAADTVRPALRD